MNTILTLHQLFLDFTQAYDSVKWKAVLDVMKEHGIPKKFLAQSKLEYELFQPVMPNLWTCCKVA